MVLIAEESDAEARLRGLEVGDDLISTPLDPREVLTRIERQVTVSKVRLALRESEAKFRSVMESAIDAIISADADGIIRTWNSAAAALFGPSEGEVVGLPLVVIGLRVEEEYKVLTLEDGSELRCHAVILATGVRVRTLDVPGVEPLLGASVYYGAA